MHGSAHAQAGQHQATLPWAVTMKGWYWALGVETDLASALLGQATVRPAPALHMVR